MLDITNLFENCKPAGKRMINIYFRQVLKESIKIDDFYCMYVCKGLAVKAVKFDHWC